MTASHRRLAGRIIRNLVVAAAVAAIFGFKAADLHVAPPTALAAR